MEVVIRYAVVGNSLQACLVVFTVLYSTNHARRFGIRITASSKVNVILKQRVGRSSGIITHRTSHFLNFLGVARHERTDSTPTTFIHSPCRGPKLGGSHVRCVMLGMWSPSGEESVST